MLSIVIISCCTYSQYYGERCIEQNFEQSSLYFNSYYLNTFSIYRFKDIAAGFVDNYFLNLHLNPAFLPDLNENEIYVYVDSRGDRKSPTIVKDRVILSYSNPEAYNYVPTDSRWFSNSRSEPEPILSFGILANPFKILSKQVIMGTSYQIIHRDEQYYTMPYGIYNTRYGYDTFNEKTMDVASSYIPNNSAGGERMVNEGHLISGFCGLKYSNNLEFGLGLNSVFHLREGNYLDLYYAPYELRVDTWGDSQFQERTQDYQHVDINFGVRYTLNPRYNIGLKIGYLLGEAKQKYISETSYITGWFYGEDDQEYYYYSNSLTDQRWDHDGYTNYLSLDLERRIDGNKKMFIYYCYTYADVDLKTNSTIVDSTYTIDQGYNNYNAVSSMKDLRHGSGTRENYRHEGMINFSWKFKAISTIRAGIYFSKNISEIVNVEPIIMKRMSSSNNDSSSYYIQEYGDKKLEWRLRSNEWSLQIPIMVSIKFKEKWNFLVAINRILSSWRIKDQTIADYKLLRYIENGETRERRNFNRIFRKPTEIITEDCSDIVLSAGYEISPGANIKLIFDPQFKDKFQIVEYWLSFESKL